MKFQLSVCPHDTAKNSVGWFFLNTYLQRKLGCAIHFEPQDDFEHERAGVLGGGFHLTYANPFSAGLYAQKLGFIPVARPVGIFDETVVVRSAERPWPVQGRRVRVASATDQLIVHGLGLTALPELGLAAADCDFEFVGTHAKAAHAVIQGKADLGFVFNETWHGLASSSQQALAIAAQTHGGAAYHCFCIAPEWADKLHLVRDVLCGMKDDPAGQGILADLKFNAGFEPVGADDLKALHRLINAPV